MFYLIDKEKNKIIDKCNKPFYQDWFDLIDWNNTTDEQKDLINIYNQWEEILTLKSKYKSIQKEIVDIKSELQEIEDTFDTYNTTGMSIATKQKAILSWRLSELRIQKDELVLSAIEKYWEEVLNEL